MVTISEGAKHILTSFPSDPLDVARVFGHTEEECWEYLIEYNRVLNECAQRRDPLAIKKAVADWINSEPEKNNLRIEAIKEQLKSAKENPKGHNQQNVKKLLFEVSILMGRAERPTPEMISKAKDYPIQNLLNLHGSWRNKGNVSCPFHKDKTPSFQIKKNNTFTCYSCGEYGDSIDLYQKIKNASFVEAVVALSQ